MKKRIKQLSSNPLIKGSAIIFFGTLAANIFNFFFNFFMVRNLSVGDYGVLASLVSLILLFALISESFIPAIIHFSGTLFAKEELGKVRDLFFRLNKLFILSGVIVFAAFFFFGSQIALFFKIPQDIFIILTAVVVLFNFLLVVNKGILQANLSFGYITFISFVAALSKFVAGIALVFLGYKVLGAMWAFIIGAILSYGLTFPPLSFLFRGKRGESDKSMRKILGYGTPSAISLLAVTSFITSDILLVKHFFPETEAGVYAGLSLLARIIFFFSAPIAQVMFPLVVQRKAREEKYAHLFQLSFILVLAASAVITIFYYLFPEFGIRILLNKEEYLLEKSLLGVFGIFLTMFSLLFLTTNFFLATKRTRIVVPLFIGASLQVVLIWFYHSSFLQIITISLSIVSLLLVYLLLYYWKLYGASKGNT